jgi:L,D-transpeptidase catalytic domain
MPRTAATAVALCLLASLLACSPKQPPSEPAKPADDEPKLSAEALAAIEKQKLIDEKFPLHGLVTGLQLKVRMQPDPEATVLGWLRVGSRVRLAAAPTKTPTCASGWYPVAMKGYACAGEGIEVGATPPESPIAVVPPARDAALPYSYYFVKDEKVPEYHRLPSRDEQRAAEAFGARLIELAQKDPKKAQRLLAGELPGEPRKLDLVRRYVEKGFFVASTGFEVRAFRKFVRTVRGSYMKQVGLEPRPGPSFHGVALDESTTLPVAWAVRGATTIIPKLRDDGTLRLVTDEGSKPIERLARVPWVKRERIGDQVFHKLDDGHYLKAWYVAVAEKIERPKDVPPSEPWVHVNIERQTLVVYRGDTPIYATLVSTGLPGHDTPVGLFEIRSKHVSATMSDIGPDVSEDLRYSIEDVPWTQYFSGSVALHGAFWHAGFGLPHSHGCVNIAPLDAHWVFEHTLPELDEGFHGVTTDGTKLRGAKVWITEK